MSAPHVCPGPRAGARVGARHARWCGARRDDHARQRVRALPGLRARAHRGGRCTARCSPPRSSPRPGSSTACSAEIRAGSRRSRRRWSGGAGRGGRRGRDHEHHRRARHRIERFEPVRSSVATGRRLASRSRSRCEGGVGQVPAGWAYVTGGHEVAVSVAYGVEPNDYQVRVKPARRNCRDPGDDDHRRTVGVRGRGGVRSRSRRGARSGSSVPTATRYVTAPSPPLSSIRRG